VVTTILKTSAADLFAQKVVEKKEDTDWRRNALFTFWGFAYLGCFQYYLYNTVFVRMCAPLTSVVGHYGSAPVKTFIDQCLHHPFVYFPAFYLLKGVAEDRPLASSYVKYKEDLWENCKALWALWVPAQLVNFALVPRHLRIPFVAGVSFFWTVILSSLRGKLDPGHRAEAVSKSAVVVGHSVQEYQAFTQPPVQGALASGAGISQGFAASEASKEPTQQ